MAKDTFILDWKKRKVLKPITTKELFGNTYEKQKPKTKTKNK